MFNICKNVICHIHDFLCSGFSLLLRPSVVDRYFHSSVCGADFSTLEQKSTLSLKNWSALSRWSVCEDSLYRQSLGEISINTLKHKNFSNPSSSNLDLIIYFKIDKIFFPCSKLSIWIQLNSKYKFGAAQII